MNTRSPRARRLTAWSVGALSAAAVAVSVATVAAAAATAPAPATHAEARPNSLPVNSVITITNDDSGQCLAPAPNTGGVNGTAIQLWGCDNTTAQQWRVLSEPGGPGGYVALQNVGFSTSCLDADTTAIDQPGRKVQLWTCNNTAEQSWHVNTLSYGGFNLLVNDAPDAPQLDADSTTIGDNGTKVQLWGPPPAFDVNETWHYQIVSTPPTPRIAVLKGGAAEFKDNGLATAWDTTAWNGSSVKQYKVDGDMIGVLTTDGELWAKQGDLGEPWIDEASGVKDFALAASSGRIGVILDDGNGTVWVKDGGTEGSWNKTEANGAAELRLSGDWIGVVSTGGVAQIKTGTLAAGWTQQGTGVKDMEMDATSGRVGLVFADGNETTWVKEGGPTSTAWNQGFDNKVKQLRIAGQWVGVVHDDGGAWVKNGKLDSGWGQEQAGNVTDLELDYASGYIGVIQTNGDVWVKNGGTDGGWDTGEENGAGGLGITSYQP